MVRKNKALALSPLQQALVIDALKQLVRISNEVNELDVVEYQALKADAQFGRRMRQPPSTVTDAQLAEARDLVVREFHGNRRMTKRDIYNRVSRLVGRHPFTVRDRLLKMQRK